MSSSLYLTLQALANDFTVATDAQVGDDVVVVVVDAAVEDAF